MCLPRRARILRNWWRADFDEGNVIASNPEAAGLTDKALTLLYSNYSDFVPTELDKTHPSVHKWVETQRKAQEPGP